MSVVEMDGFDYYDTADIGNRGWTGTNFLSIDTGNSRNGGRCMRNTYWNAGVPSFGFVASSQMILGIAVKCDTLPAATRNFIYFRSGTTVMCSVQVMSDGKMRLIDANGGTIGTTAAQAVFTGTYHFFEFKIVVGDTGSFELRVDGVAKITGTSVDTKGGAATTIDNIKFFDDIGAEAGHPYWDDLYVINMTDGVLPTDYIGDCIVDSLNPNGDGSQSQLTGSDGNSVNNSLLVDETVHNGDTDYVEHATVGNEDLYAVTDIGGTRSVYGVALRAIARKSDTNIAKTATLQCKTGADETASASKTLASPAYTFYHDVRALTPSGTAWTQSSFNSAEFGFKVNSGVGATTARLTKLTVEAVHGPFVAHPRSSAAII